jgi:hypothetical protein
MRVKKGGRNYIGPRSGTEIPNWCLRQRVSTNTDNLVTLNSFFLHCTYIPVDEAVFRILVSVQKHLHKYSSVYAAAANMGLAAFITNYVAPVFIIVSPLTSYADQIYSIHRTRSSAGFSLDIPLIMLVASMLRWVHIRTFRVLENSVFEEEN